MSKSCYVFGRIALEVPIGDGIGNLPVGFMLVHHAIETGIKACLRTVDIEDAGHKFKKLLNAGIKSGNNNLAFLGALLTDPASVELLSELEQQYAGNKYYEVGHFIRNHEAMMDTIDQIMLALLDGYSLLRGSNLEEHRIINLHPSQAELFRRKLKQPLRIIIRQPAAQP